MEELNIQTIFKIYHEVKELPQDVQQLIEEASIARLKAYAPYSNFAVGVAIQLENDEVVTGNNQENASYPSGLCAERTAIYYANANYPNIRILKMAIVAGSLNKITNKAIPPCGACRQTIAEYEIKQNQPIEIYFKGEQGHIFKSESLKNLLPLVFDKDQL